MPVLVLLDLKAAEGDGKGFTNEDVTARSWAHNPHLSFWHRGSQAGQVGTNNVQALETLRVFVMVKI